MKTIEPGERQTIKYGKGHELEVTCLSIRQEIKLAKLEAEVRADRDAAKIFEMLITNLREVTVMTEEEFDSWIDTINVDLAQEILKKVNEINQLSEDELKK
jgi:hypothetical protein